MTCQTCGGTHYIMAMRGEAKSTLCPACGRTWEAEMARKMGEGIAGKPMNEDTRRLRSDDHESSTVAERLAMIDRAIIALLTPDERATPDTKRIDDQLIKAASHIGKAKRMARGMVE